MKSKRHNPTASVQTLLAVSACCLFGLPETAATYFSYASKDTPNKPCVAMDINFTVSFDAFDENKKLIGSTMRRTSEDDNISVTGSCGQTPQMSLRFENDLNSNSNWGFVFNPKRNTLSNPNVTPSGGSNTTQCLAAGALFRRYLRDNGDSLNKTCPDVVKQLNNCRCATELPKVEHTHFHIESSYDFINSVIAVVVMNAVCFSGILILSRLNAQSWNYFLQFLVAVSVGTMMADSLMHLIPYGLLLNTGIVTDTDTALLRDGKHMGSVALVAVYLFFFMEYFFIIYTVYQGQKFQKTQSEMLVDIPSGHSSTNAHEMASTYYNGEDSFVPQVMASRYVKVTSFYSNSGRQSMDASSTTLAVGEVADEDSVHSATSNSKPHPDKTGDGTPTPVATHSVSVRDHSFHRPIASQQFSHHRALGAQSRSNEHHRLLNKGVVFAVLLGDIVHNICNAVTIGAMFSLNLNDGIRTTLAVFANELPQELGEFAVLLGAGVSKRTAVLLHLFGCATSFLGVFLGYFLVNLFNSMRNVVFMWSAGIFLHISLADLMPQMCEVFSRPGEPWYIHLILQVGGIVLGTIILEVLFQTQNMA